MAHVTMPDGREFDVEDGDKLALDYYRNEGAEISGIVEAPVFPVQFDGEAPVVPPGEFDPAEHTVPEVLDYLDGAEPDEQDRVLAAERLGQARKGIVGDDT